MTQKRSHWYVTSRRVITRARRDGRAIGLEGKALVAFVDARYPFTERRGFAYTCWLEARRAMLGSLLPKGKGRPSVPLDPDCLVLAAGRDAGPAFEAAVMRKRARLHEAGILADDLSDEEVAAWEG